MKKIMIGIVFVLSLMTAIPAEKVGVLDEVLKVNNIFVDHSQLYVAEGTRIYVYSLKDVALVTSFGQEGEGPQEFRTFVAVTPLDDALLINSLGKISYYKRDGTFIREIKTGAGLGSNLFYPLKDGYIGRGFIQDDNKNYLTVNFYDAELNKGEELYRMLAPFQSDGKIRLLTRAFVYQVHGDRIFLGGKEGFVIDVLDHTGTHLFTVQREYKRRHFTEKDESDLREVLKLQYRDAYEANKERIEFPEKFPEIMNFFIDQDQIYVATWKRQGKKIEFFIFDMKGNEKHHLYIPFQFQNVIQPYPSQIKNGKLYQVVENDDEEWELHVSAVL